MTEPAPPANLADRALTRLRKLASGNGLEPASIAVLEKQEQIFTIAGKMEISPLCETESVSYPGGPRGKDKKIVASFAALQGAVGKHRQEFRENPEWIAAATAEIRSHDSQGWGLENAKVTLPEKSAIYAASETCPSCQGQKLLTCTQCNGRGSVTCTQCQGQGREQCYYCGGRGEDPQQPGQKCHTCQGTRMAPCRFCQMNGYLSCPTCNGKRGTPCPSCQANGKITQEVTVTCGAETHFRMIAEGLPSGLRRGLDRIGVNNLGKGHADITAEAPPEDEEEKHSDGKPIPVLNYKALLPYAELRMGLGPKKAVISVVGKRCAISGVPAFLDTPLQPWRDKLKLAVDGKAPLIEAIEARALKDVLSLTVTGKGRLEELRKLYPFGLSAEAMTELLSNMQLALNRTTLKTRTMIALLAGGCGVVLFYVLFMLDFENLITPGLNRWVDMIADFGILGAMLTASWALLNFSTRFVLKKRFPQMTLALQQKIGKTGLSMQGAIVAAFFVFLLLAPVKPLWLALLLRR